MTALADRPLRLLPPPDLRQVKHEVAEEVAERVMLSIWRSGMTQQCVAELVGMSGPVLSGRLRCRTVFNVEEVARIADTLGLDLEGFVWLLMAVASPSAAAGVRHGAPRRGGRPAA